MPSVRSVLAGLLATTLFQLSTASPIPIEEASDCLPSKPVAVTPTIPPSGNVPDLPTTNLTLLYVAIGRGIQNYTCTAAGATPSAVGAIATLFDATSLAFTDETAVHAIPPVAVYMPQPTSSLALKAGVFNPIGHHYFDAAGTPTFDLTAVDKILFGGKTGDVKAPTTANVGPDGTGAVDWLQLTKKSTYTSVGVQVAYRLVTAGGSAPATCSNSSLITVPYAAEYWFYN
ncbi:uncharacterized protein LY89DRAFT_653261 [Mollisia scopiformis]|uniref:Malate dehydrogenase n=1 Tax=Mollisia scopiformis TaxID=149040 RepID=A0A194WV26_MOLSC|nr:uncharacterized protein LY89DRAFT_653261 [Mollisia scopiformis]KUJ11821.1 hypothetical protein LY89DRAFT_653261 [Mollisia scopiformis]